MPQRIRHPRIPRTAVLEAGESVLRAAARSTGLFRFHDVVINVQSGSELCSRETYAAGAPAGRMSQDGPFARREPRKIGSDKTAYTNAGPTRFIAAPAGGASKEGRGCPTSLAAFLTIATLAGGAAAAQSGGDSVDVPSGTAVSLQETLEEATATGGTRLRFRFVAADLAGLVETPDRLSADMDALCDSVALPAIGEGPTPERVVISLSSEPTEFGVAAPSVLQVFESYSVANGACVWEAF